MTTKKLIRRQAYWVKFLLEFHFIISYTLDKKIHKADLLTRRLNNLLSDDNKDRQQHLL